MRALFHDLSFAFRQLVKHRLYAITAILSMALGIGATAAVYSVLYGVLIDPYPYRDAARIAFINIEDKHGRGGDLQFTMAEVDQLRRAKSVEDVIAQQDVDMVATGGELPETTKVLELTGNGFQFLGAPPMLGREFAADEAPEGASPPPVAVISYPFWKSHFAGSPAAIGTTLELNHRRYTIIGVTGPRFTWHDSDVYLPMPTGIDPKTRFQTLIRLRKGIPPATYEGEIDGLVRQFGRAEPDLLPRDGFEIKVESLNDTLLGQFKGTLFVLFMAVALLLLIGCGNVSMLMLARGTARQQELAMRSALGASRLRIVRQLLTEAVLLSIAGGALGMAIAYLAIHLITGLLPQYSIPHEVVIALNLPVLLFSTAVSVATGIAAGLWPAVQFSRPRIVAISQAGGTRSVTARGSRMRAVMMTGQIALTVLLLAGAGAAMRTFLDAYTARLGFDPHNALMMDLTMPEDAYPTWEARVHYLDELVGKVRATPGVKDAALYLGGTPPRGNWIQPVEVVGAQPDESRRTGVRLVSADYFSVLRIPLLQGRTMTPAEVLRGAHMTVVSKTFVQRYLPNSDPIGRLIVLKPLAQPYPGALLAPNAEQPFEVVGVVGDVINNGLHDPVLPQAYVPSSIVLFPVAALLVRTAGDPRQSVHAITASLHALNQNQAVSDIYAYDDFLSMFAWAYDRFISVLFAVFSSVALGLAAIGLFSVVAYTVEQRTREIGIRMALGARQWHVLATTLLSTAWTTGVGLALGIAFSAGLSNTFYHWTQSSMRNAGLLAIISGVFLVVSAMACTLPARRAMRVDPMVALRSE